MADHPEPSEHLPIRLSRREFLATGALASLAAATGCRGDSEPASPPARPTVQAAPATPPLPGIEAVGPQTRPLLTRAGFALGGGKGQDPGTGAAMYWLAVVDLDRGEKLTHIPTPFFPHGVAPHPVHPHVLMLFEKHGEGCCQVDLRAGRVTATVSTVDGNQFYGHGSYSRDGSHFFCTETAVEDGYRGLLMVRDSASFEARGELPTGGKEPHDCVLIGGGRTLVVTNGGGHIDNGGQGCVTYINPQTREVEHTLRFSDPTINAGHLWLTSRGQLAVVSAPRAGLDAADPKVHGALSLFTPGVDRAPRTLSGPVADQMRGETLSVAIHEASMVVGATSPDGDLLSFWDFETGKLLRAFRQLPGPRGINLTLDRRHWVVTYGPEAALLLIDVETLQAEPQGRVARSWLTGSHVVCHDWQA